MIKAEETNLLDLVVYREYSGELTGCCLQLSNLGMEVMDSWLSLIIFRYSRLPR